MFNFEKNLVINKFNSGLHCTSNVYDVKYHQIYSTLPIYQSNYSSFFSVACSITYRQYNYKVQQARTWAGTPRPWRWWRWWTASTATASSRCRRPPRCCCWSTSAAPADALTLSCRHLREPMVSDREYLF